MENLGEQSVAYYSRCVSHRMVEVGRTSGGSSPLLGQDHLELVAQDHITEWFELEGSLALIQF